MGRPSIARERRQQILDAFEECVAEHGLRDASFSRVGRAIGLDRSTLHHYFHTREELLSALIERVSSSYIRRMEEAVSMLPGEDRAIALIDHFFSSSFHQPKFSRLFAELKREAIRDRDVRRLLKRVYKLFEDTILPELQKDFPDAPAAKQRNVTLALASLVEGSTVFAVLGFESDYREAGRLMAHEMLKTLRSSDQ